jgi:hypothetical protein
VALFRSGGRSTQETVVRRPRREIVVLRKLSLAGGDRRPRQGQGRTTASEGRVFTLPTHAGRTALPIQVRKAASQSPSRLLRDLALERRRRSRSLMCVSVDDLCQRLTRCTVSASSFVAAHRSSEPCRHAA